ncbi:hypothetical protein PsYK624_077310 [Phanerochaete sordida]|uniref:Uncharacterized protein n=1 Tax=Phanerochaete sordida TaxID=48140 RepID=A0A9P3GB11_9APHY|nr:hypothetical protein PsYK624_077310 [Phanerochaete sordida]
MQSFGTLFALALVAAATASAMSVEARGPEPVLVRRITDPGNPGNLINCPPHGGADRCSLEKPCSRIRINYGSPKGGHYIWYNYDINNIPSGIEVEEEDSCTDYKEEEL